jgi:hypothetical protein
MENENGNVNDNTNTNVKKGGRKAVWIVIVIIILAVAGYFGFKSGKISVPFVVPSVATVNGVPIPKATFDTQLKNAIASYQAQGIDATSTAALAQIKQQVLNNLINNEVLNQAAKSAGITASSTAVDNQYQTIVTQEGGADKLAADLKKDGMTDAQLRQNIANQLADQTYLLQNIDVGSITASDDEIAQFYAQYSAQQKAAGQTVPALTSLSAQIKQQIITNKENAAVNSLIAALVAKATIATSTNL